MRLILLVIIKFYWKFIPKNKRRTCLFKESCSQYVYKTTIEHGFFKGTTALWNRQKVCRAGYCVYQTNNGFEMKLIDGSIISEKEISAKILERINISPQHLITALPEKLIKK